MTRITLTVEDPSKAKDFLEQLEQNSSVIIDSVLDKGQIDNMLMASEEAIRHGPVISQSELEKEILSWKGR